MGREHVYDVLYMSLGWRICLKTPDERGSEARFGGVG